MKTLDGHILNDGDSCFVTCQDPMGDSKISPNPRKAFYRDEGARMNRYDFTIPSLRVDFEVEVTGVWKNEP